MKEITRIHIAKVPYDVELTAKKELEAYLKALEAYSEDAEIIQDVEIRITEILNERGIKKDAVISEDDVKALKQQLGEPRDFLGEGDIAVGPEDEAEMTNDTPRKLYRSLDNAVLGGVLSGIAAFFKINPTWMRLIFIILAFASFGTAILVYIVLWIAVPPAKTAADKLQMAGRQVTVSSIRELNENEAGKLAAASNPNARRTITMLIGIFSVFGALGTIAFTTIMMGAGIFRAHDVLFSNKEGSGLLSAAFILALVSGLLLTTLFILGAYASFAQKITRRVLVSGCVIVVLGLASFGTAIGLVQYASLQRDHVVEANTHTYPVTLPSGVKDTTSLQVVGKDVDVNYIVSTDQPSATFRILGDKNRVPKVTVAMDKNTLLVRTTQSESSKNDCTAIWTCGDFRQTLEIRGPALSQLEATDGTMVSYQTQNQAELAVTAGKNTRVTFDSGKLMNVHLIANENAVVAGSEAAISHLDVTLEAAAELEFGAVETVSLTDQNSCPAHSESRVALWKVSSETIIINGATMPAKSTDLACTRVAIRNEEK